MTLKDIKMINLEQLKTSLPCDAALAKELERHLTGKPSGHCETIARELQVGSGYISWIRRNAEGQVPDRRRLQVWIAINHGNQAALEAWPEIATWQSARELNRRTPVEIQRVARVAKIELEKFLKKNPDLRKPVLSVPVALDALHVQKQLETERVTSSRLLQANAELRKQLELRGDGEDAHRQREKLVLRVNQAEVALSSSQLEIGKLRPQVEAIQGLWMRIREFEELNARTARELSESRLETQSARNDLARLKAVSRAELSSLIESATRGRTAYG